MSTAMQGKAELKSNPNGWLLETGGPAIRWQVLTDLVGRSLVDPSVLKAREELAADPLVCDLFGLQRENGTWSGQDYYLPRAGSGTFWVLTILADYGLSAKNERIHRACEYFFKTQREDGTFCRVRHIPGQGCVWQSSTEPCTQARIARFMLQFGYGDDPRLRKAIDWLVSLQRQDGMWFCRGEEGCGCLRASLDFLRLACLDPQTAASDPPHIAANAIMPLLSQPKMQRYHVGPDWGTWERLKYPYFGISIISALDALGRLGYGCEHQEIAAALDYLLERQSPEGSWPADDTWPLAPLRLNQPEQAAKWLTLDALRVINLLRR